MASSKHVSTETCNSRLLAMDHNGGGHPRLTFFNTISSVQCNSFNSTNNLNIQR